MYLFFASLFKFEITKWNSLLLTGKINEFSKQILKTGWLLISHTTKITGFFFLIFRYFLIINKLKFTYLKELKSTF